MFSWFVNLKGVSGNLRFTDLLDTIVSSPVDGQVPVFDSSNNKWYNKYVSIAKDDFIWISGTNDTDMVWTGGVKFQVNIPIPNFMNDFGTASIEARVIYEGGQIREIAMFRSAKATITATSNHNELGGLQGGTTDEYYHLTQAEYSTLQSGVSGSFTTADGKTVTSGIITSIV